MQAGIKKWGNSAGVIIPTVALAQAGIKLGDAIEIEAEKGQITIRVQTPQYTLNELLAASPASAVAFIEEDKAWLHSDPIGKEII